MMRKINTIGFRISLNHNLVIKVASLRERNIDLIIKVVPLKEMI